MGRVSSGAPKSGPPAHANRHAFRHNPGSKLTQKIIASPINDLCPPCHAVLEWRKKYRKYKPLTVAKKCVRCQQKAVKEAYHVICTPCVRKDRCCGKCLQAEALWPAASTEVAAGEENKNPPVVEARSEEDNGQEPGDEGDGYGEEGESEIEESGSDLE